MSQNDQPVTVDVALKLLSDPIRRRSLRYLSNVGPVLVSVDELAAMLAANDAETERLAIMLYHLHLPKLAEERVIEYDPSRQLVRYRPIGVIEDRLEAICNR